MLNIPITNLSTETILFPINENKENTIIVSPDIGGIARARNYSSLFKTDLAIVNKTRDLNNICSMSEIIGAVANKNCIIVDDIVDGASTLCMATDLLLKKGAKSVEAIITHAVLSQDAITKIENSEVNKIYITDSIYHQNLSKKFAILTVHKLISSALS